MLNLTFKNLPVLNLYKFHMHEIQGPLPLVKQFQQLNLTPDCIVSCPNRQ
jgi:hypothetical protein